MPENSKHLEKGETGTERQKQREEEEGLGCCPVLIGQISLQLKPIIDSLR